MIVVGQEIVAVQDSHQGLDNLTHHSQDTIHHSQDTIQIIILAQIKMLKGVTFVLHQVTFREIAPNVIVQDLDQHLIIIAHKSLSSKEGFMER
jgi:hypothetical protein